jgi:hypothetical protein
LNGFVIDGARSPRVKFSSGAQIWITGSGIADGAAVAGGRVPVSSEKAVTVAAGRVRVGDGCCGWEAVTAGVVPPAVVQPNKIRQKAAGRSLVFIA